MKQEIDPELKLRELMFELKSPNLCWWDMEICPIQRYPGMKNVDTSLCEDCNRISLKSFTAICTEIAKNEIYDEHDYKELKEKINKLRTALKKAREKGIQAGIRIANQNISKKVDNLIRITRKNPK